jgi:hypothetical protein
MGSNLRVMFSRAWMVCVLLGASAACHRKRRLPAVAQPSIAPTTVEAATQSATPEENVIDPDELLPGTSHAFGLTLPSNTAIAFENEGTKMYYVRAQMPRVMRYLQQRVSYVSSDIQPLGAFIRAARPNEIETELIVDIGVRDEGDRTLITLWNRTPPPPAPTRSLEEGLRATGIDPVTRRFEPRYNR